MVDWRALDPVLRTRAGFWNLWTSHTRSRYHNQLWKRAL